MAFWLDMKATLLSLVLAVSSTTPLCALSQLSLFV